MHKKEYALGAVLNPPDNRDIPLALVQAPVKLPSKYQTDLSEFPVEDQKRNGSCVGQAEGKAVEYFDRKETGVLTRVSKRFVYAICKLLDGLQSEGTYPRVAAKVLSEQGAPREDLIGDDNDLAHAVYIDVKVTPAIKKDAYLRRTGGYAFVAATAQDIMQAIYQNGVVNATLEVGAWGKLPVKPTPYSGRHRIILYGFEVKKERVKIFFRNSWGKNWGDKGNGWFYFDEYEGKIHDIMAYTDIPNEILQEAKETQFIFTRDLERGMSGQDVLQLQKRLSTEVAFDQKMCFQSDAFDVNFGPLTEDAVQRYQKTKGIASSGTPSTTGYGRLGSKTRASLNAQKKNSVELYPKVAQLRDLFVGIMAAVGHPIMVTDEYRSYAEQDALYAKGRTTPGPIVTNAKGGDSFHNHRVAFDIAFRSGSGITYEGPWDMAGEIAEVLGLEWGGKWENFVDRPHFQFTAGYSIQEFKEGKIDKARFGEIVQAASDTMVEVDFISPSDNNPMMKRFKSFLISATSLVITALAVVIFTPEWATFVQDLYGWLSHAGIPASVVAIVGLLVAEIWKSILNQRMIERYRSDYGAAATRSQSGLDLY